MPFRIEYEELMEYVNEMCESFDEEEQWIRDELIELLGIKDTRYWQGFHLQINQEKGGLKAQIKRENERCRVLHNIFIEKGLESPFEDFPGFRKMKYNPDKKKGGKKKKGGRRRV